MKARGNHIGSITDLMTSCRAAGQEELAAQLALELQNALDSLKWQVQPDLKLVAEIRQQVRQAPWLRYKNERRISDLPLHLEVEMTDRVGHLYNHVRKQIEDLLINKAPIEAFKASWWANRSHARCSKTAVSSIGLRRRCRQDRRKERATQRTTGEGQDRMGHDPKGVRQELRRQKLFAKNQAQGAYRDDEDRAKYEMKAILAYIRIWAQNKAENRMGWLQALNRIVCTGQRSSGSILFLAFPQELILKLAERTGGKPVRVHVPKLYDGLVRTDSAGRAFLVDPLKGGGQKHTFLFKYRDGKILLDDDKPEQAKGETLTESCAESETAEAAIQAAICR